MIETKCTECSKNFLVKTGEINRSKSKNMFCSRSCAGTFNGRKRTRKGSVRVCKSCQNTYVFKNNKPSRVYCGQCKAKNPNKNYDEKTLLEVIRSLSIAGKHPSWKWSYVRNRARQKHKELLGLPCFRCGYSLHVELAHIKALSSFPETAKVSEVNDRKNVVQLCRNCHWELDRGLWSM